ncbi:hypothetical protein RsS62_23640 [Rhizobium dioscoreae]|nr:hypothetical protein RsS62_23640 [Rhizobium dioscoreae]
MAGISVRWAWARLCALRLSFLCNWALRLVGGSLAAFVGLFGLLILLDATPALAASCQYNMTFTATGSGNAKIAQTYNDGCDGQGAGLFRSPSDDWTQPNNVGISGYEAVTSSQGNTYYFRWNAPPVGDSNGGYSIYLGSPQIANGPDSIVLYAASMNDAVSTPDTTVTFNFTIPNVAGPTVSAISPNHGSTGGGTAVTITGTGFVAGSTTVTIGGNAATSVSVASPTSLTAVTPAGTAGAASVIVTTSGASNSANSLYTYVTPPTASSFSYGTTVPYNSGSASATSIDVSGHVTNSPSSYAVGSATTAQGGSVSINSSGSVSYTPPIGFRGNDSFTYVATNSGGTSSPATVTVTVGNPTITVTPTTLTTATYGSSYSQSLTASGGKAPYTFSTTLASGALPAGLTLSSSGTLSGTPTAAGHFTFTVTGTDSSDGAGPATFTSSTISLTVNAVVPGAPTIGSVTAGNGQATVSFAAPASNGGAAITGYTVTSSPGGFTATGTGSPISLTGLTNGTSYTFTVKATNSVGTGSASPASSAVTPSTVPGAPTIGSATARNGQVTVGFSAPASDGGAAITSYTVTSSPGGFTATSTGSPITVTGLTNGTSYTFTVTATNVNGTGAASSASNAVTPATVPGAPTIGSVTPGNGQALIAFSAPASNGGAAITSYTVTSSPGGLTGTGSASPIVVAGLTNGTAYTFTVTATNSVGTGSASSSSSAVTPLTMPGAPTISSVTAGNGQATVAFTPPVSNGGAAITSYTVTSNPGGFTATGTGSPLTVTGLSNGTSYTFTVTATNASGTGSASLASSAVTPATIPGAPTIGSVTADNGQATVAFTPPASNGGAAITSYTVTSSPGGLTGTGSTSPIVVAGLTNGTAYTFTVTATNTIGTGAASSASGAVTPSTVPGAPTISSVTAGNGQATVAFTPPASNGGAAITSYTVTSNPAGLTASGSGSPLTVTGLTNGTSYTFTVTATNASGTGAASASSSSVTPVAAPTAGAVSMTVAANSSANPVTLALSGGTATAVAVATAPAHGTATASGTAITYKPTSGYSGSDSFTYTATNATGTSAPATVSVTISAPTLTFSPPGSTLPAGVVNVAYSQTVTASGGTSPYGYAVVGTLPGGLSLNHATGAITGTPTAAGNYSFSISATDANNATSSAAYTIAVAPPAATLTFSPSGGALPQAMAGEAYSQQITATGGVGTTIYSLASGTLPNGLILNISTGQLTGPLAAGTQGDYSFSIQARDSNGSTATVAFTLKVIQRAVSATDQVINVPEGSTPPDVYLNRGATGGPFTSADLAFVTPPNAGTVTIIQGQLAQAGPATAPVGWYLHYTPDPAYSGQVRVGFKLVSALGTSNVGTITYNVRYDAAKVAEDIDGLVRSFVQSRQNMIANTIEVPGLLQRRQMQKATDPITALASPSEQGMKLGFSTSLAQMRAARGDNDAGSAPFNVWIGGAFLIHDDKSKKDSTSKWGSFGMVNMGVDYLLSEKALVGVSFHYDRMTDPTDQDAKLTGNGWLAGPYASLELGKGVFWNGSLRYGGSSNTINTQFWDGGFKTTRWMADTSIEGQWDLDEATTISPKLRAVYFSEKVDDYTVKNSSGDAITIDGFNEDQFRVSLGAEIARSFTMEDGTKLTPKLGVTGGFSGLDGSGAFGAVTAGMSLETASFWMLDTSILFNIEGDGQKSVGAKVAASKKF